VNKNLHKNRNHLFDLYKLTEIVKRGIVKYEDPFTNLVKNLYINFDFESAAENIAEIQEVIRKDVLLLPTQNRILEGCYFLYYKVYCKIH
jgi:translation initiation factor 3 subunit E